MTPIHTTPMRTTLLTAVAVGLLSGHGVAPAQGQAAKPAAKPAAEQAPNADQFYLNIESLVDNVADFELRRFTIIAQEGKTLKFTIGGAGMASKGHRTTDDQPGVRRWRRFSCCVCRATTPRTPRFAGS